MVQILDPATGAATGIGMVFMVPVVLPIAPPTSKLVGSAFLGPDGKPLGGTVTLEGPAYAQTRVLLKRSAMTEEAKAELDAAEAAERRRLLTGIGLPAPPDTPQG